MSVYGIGTGYFAWQATEKIQKKTSRTDFADMIANKETKKAGIYAGAENSASKKDVERVTEEYKKKHPDKAVHVDSQLCQYSLCINAGIFSFFSHRKIWCVH